MHVMPSKHSLASRGRAHLLPAVLCMRCIKPMCGMARGFLHLSGRLSLQTLMAQSRLGIGEGGAMMATGRKHGNSRYGELANGTPWYLDTSVPNVARVYDYLLGRSRVGRTSAWT